jgi:Tol biopolymer transport system component
VKYDSPGDPGDVWLYTSDQKDNFTNDDLKHENVAFGPEGLIVFSRQEGEDEDTSEIWKMYDNGSGQEQLTDNEFADLHPSVSPDGQKVVFWSNSNQTKTPHLFMMNIDGTGRTELITDENIHTWDPEFSPDGTMIVFNLSVGGVTLDGVKTEIWIGKLAPQSDPPRFMSAWSLTASGFQWTEFDPTWSPDGTMVAYSVYEGPSRWWEEGLNPYFENIFDWYIILIKVGADGKPGTKVEPYLVRTDPGLYAVPWLPCFSPEGGQVAFVSTRFDPEQWTGYQDYPWNRGMLLV